MLQIVVANAGNRVLHLIAEDEKERTKQRFIMHFLYSEMSLLSSIICSIGALESTNLGGRCSVLGLDGSLDPVLEQKSKKMLHAHHTLRRRLCHAGGYGDFASPSRP